MTSTTSASNTTMEVEIRKLIQGSYNPTIIPKLEEYVIACCKGEVIYIFDAIRTLIKLYQLFPITNINTASTSTTSGTDTNADGITTAGTTAGSAIKNKRYSIIGYCCLLALLEYPNSIDLLSLTYMIPQTITLKESCPYIYKCNDSLRLCNYNEFWKQYESLKNSTDPIVANFATKSIPKLQCSILYVLSLSYKRVPVSIVSTACNTTNVQSIETVSKQLSSKSNDTLSFLDVIDSITTEFVIFKPTTDNTKRQRVYQEGVSFASISSLLQKMGQ